MSTNSKTAIEAFGEILSLAENEELIKLAISILQGDAAKVRETLEGIDSRLSIKERGTK